MGTPRSFRDPSSTAGCPQIHTPYHTSKKTATFWGADFELAEAVFLDNLILRPTRSPADRDDGCLDRPEPANGECQSPKTRGITIDTQARPEKLTSCPLKILPDAPASHQAAPCHRRGFREIPFSNPAWLEGNFSKWIIKAGQVDLGRSLARGLQRNPFIHHPQRGVRTNFRRPVEVPGLTKNRFPAFRPGYPCYILGDAMFAIQRPVV
jgi:hypothetical protein